MTLVIPDNMRIAISMPDALYDLAEQTAHKLGISRSNLYALAIKEFIGNHNPQDVTTAFCLTGYHNG